MFPLIQTEVAAKHNARWQRRRSQRNGDGLAEIDVGNPLGHDVGAKPAGELEADASESRGLSHALKTNLPHGWDYTAVFGLGQGATEGPVHLALGLIALLLAAGLGTAVIRAMKA